MPSLQPSTNIEGISRRSVLLSVTGAVACGLATGCGGGGDGKGDRSGLNDNPPVLSSPEGDEVILAGADRSNPLNIFRIPITRRMQVLAADLNFGIEIDMLKIDAFMHYIDRFAVGVASSNTPDAAVIEGIGACGTYTKVLLALARCAEIEGRSITFGNYPIANGHTACELRVGGEWVFFDPTTHVHYADESGRPLSYESIRERYLAGQVVRMIGGNSRRGLFNFSGEGIFLGADPQGMIGPANPLLYPLSMHLRDKSVVGIFDMGAKNQGARYIGAAYINVHQSWTLTGLVGGGKYQFVVNPESLAGGRARLHSDYKFNCRAELYGLAMGSVVMDMCFDFSKGQASSVYLDFVSGGGEANILISHGYEDDEYHYVYIRSYELRELL